MRDKALVGVVVFIIATVGGMPMGFSLLAAISVAAFIGVKSL